MPSNVAGWITSLLSEFCPHCKKRKKNNIQNKYKQHSTRNNNRTKKNKTQTAQVNDPNELQKQTKNHTRNNPEKV